MIDETRSDKALKNLAKIAVIQADILMNELKGSDQ